MFSDDPFFEDDEFKGGCGEARVPHDHAADTEMPSVRFDWKLLLGEWLDNAGDIFEHLGEFPKALARRLFADYTHQQGQRLDMAEVAKAIESIEGYANEGN